MCRSAVNDGSCSPWVMCSCSVVRGNQIRDSWHRGHIFPGLHVLAKQLSLRCLGCMLTDSFHHILQTSTAKHKKNI